jgi:hypothetical protein
LHFMARTFGVMFKWESNERTKLLETLWMLAKDCEQQTSEQQSLHFISISVQNDSYIILNFRIQHESHDISSWMFVPFLFFWK